jgi:hypothetical protein
MLGVWIDPVTAQVMMTFRELMVSVLPGRGEEADEPVEPIAVSPEPRRRSTRRGRIFESDRQDNPHHAGYHRVWFAVSSRA